MASKKPLTWIIGISLAAALGSYVTWRINPDYLPKSVSDWFYQNIGERPYTAAAPAQPTLAVETPEICPERNPQWRSAQSIEGVSIDAAPECQPDNPYAVAAAVLGTNNVTRDTLVKSGMARDAISKGRDLDNDGDPDEIEIRLEVTELNGFLPDAPIPAPGYEIAPGIKPTMWVMSPKSFGMSTVNFESYDAQPLLRAPSPVIRVEQGDVVKLTLENTHYLPHTIHMHGVDLPFKNAKGEGNDGVPGISETSVMPGGARTYEIQPRAPGLYFYHCHVQTHAHLSMGLVGMFVVEPNRPGNRLQTLNIGAGRVRFRSQASREKYDQEYDLHYHEVDQHLSSLPQESNDPRIISDMVHHVTPGSDVQANLLNGRAFPYTLRESPITVRENQKVLVNVLNTGMNAMKLPSPRTQADSGRTRRRRGRGEPALRARHHSARRLAARPVRAADDERRAECFGPGAWLIHDHRLETVTNGVSPGGEMGMIVYPEYLGENGIPKLAVDPSIYFAKEFYQRAIPVFASEDKEGRLNPPAAGEAQLDSCSYLAAGAVCRRNL